MIFDLRFEEREVFEVFRIGYNFNGEKWERYKWGRNIKSKCEAMRKG